MSEACVCEVCGGSARVRYETEQFPYGAGDDQVELIVRVPVVHCAECDASYTGEYAEKLRHEAVCYHLGRLAPAEIKAIRTLHALTQDQLAEVTGFGVASIKRWETGNQIQSQSADRFLRLLSDARNFRSMLLLPGRGQPQPSFRTKISDRSVQDAKDVKLRPPRLKMAA